MTHTSPLLENHQDREAALLPYGTPALSALVVETFGEPEIEYAAIRKGAGVIDLPHRGVIRVGGEERLEFLNRMVTQELKGATPGTSVNAFWINRKGRIDADLRVIVRDEDVLLELDMLCVAKTIETLDALIIADDVTLEDATESLHRLGVHGPRAIELLRAAGVELGDIASNENRTIDGLTIDRRDATGEVGLDLIVPADRVRGLYETIGAAIDERAELKAKRIGWSAFNTARIEAGSPLFNLDFGEKSLPAETGVLNDRVSFTKGCYPGQEVVARMRSLGGPKQSLVALAFEDPGDPTLQPATGDAVTLRGEEKPIGAITSSTRSPMRSDAIVCLAQVKTAHAGPGTELDVHSRGVVLRATVREGLVAWQPAGSGA
ncbi:MAG: glycine cleavage T C-terminal barrel domain-containing protein [Phycisphaerales bacterium]